METIKFFKTRDVALPSRGTPGSAGLDFYVPRDEAPRTIRPGEDANIPSGLKVKVPAGHALILSNKSGVSLRKRLQTGACVIDEDYQGEIHLHVYNTGNSPVSVSPGEKLVQGLLIPITYATPEEALSEEEMWDGPTVRGTGGFGSTGQF